MAFHVACPITCKRICFCTLGFPERLQREGKRSEFLEEVLRVEEFLRHPVSVRVGGKTAVQVPVPRIAPPTIDGGDGGGVAGDREEILSAQTKRAALQRRAVAASLAAEDYARRFEAGNLADVSGEIVGELAGEEQGSSVVKVMCRICYSGENEGSDRAMRMLLCKTCGKKYHKNCLKSWAEHRDLFHWSSWACPSCRICEVCRRAGDPNKFMFCKRCDGAYHCYCQQPPHKNISHGPFLCPKHTRCHSCGSTVSGSGLSTRWFLGYTCCDACGRLFVKGKYCPVCLKVYRDSESTPMVCCDDCERWVHCECDGISDEMYRLFQADGNLYYKCTACRGDCYQVRDLADAVQELWRRRDKADKDQIASLRAAAGLPSQEEIFCSSPYSDDEENGPVIVKNDHSRSLKLSVKGLIEKATKNTDDHGKKSSKSLYPKKKNSKMKGYRVSLVGKTEEPHRPFERIQEARALESNLAAERDDKQSYRNEGPVFVSLSNKKDKPHISPVWNDDKGHKVVQIKSTGKHASKIDAVKGTKLVIHLGARNKTATNSPRSEASSCEREQDLATTNGSEDSGQIMLNERRRMPETQDGTSQLDQGKGVNLNSELQLKSSKHRGRQKDLIKLGKGTSEASDLIHNNGRGNANKKLENTPEGKTSVISISKPTINNNDTAQWKLSKGPSISLCRENHDNSPSELVSDSPPKDPKPLLKLKFKNPYVENRSLWPLHGEDERTSVKGQRSKRKRPSPSMEKTPVKEEDIDEGNLQRDRPVEEAMDANWILKKLGKDAIGKRVEVHQSSDNSWHKGVITDMINGTSALVVSLDDGRSKTLELGKQGVRFISQKQKRTRTVLL